MITTKYFNKVGDIPLSEYPRPQFKRDSYMCLNGKWNCAFTNSAELPEMFPVDILVPFSPETELSRVNRLLKPNEFMHYKRTFNIDKDFNKGRVILHFGAVDQIAEVYINGRSVFYHVGGYTPFEVDITKYIVQGENTLCVSVQDFTDTKSFSRGKQKLKRGQIWYSAQSGIWQSVWLESVSENYIKSVKITPDFDEKSVLFDFVQIGEKENIKVCVYDKGKLVLNGETKNGSLTLKFEDFNAWSPENPYLYSVTFETKNDFVKSYFAMRKFSYGRDGMGVMRFMLNNKPYFLTGVLDQGYYPESLLTPPCEKAMQNDVAMMKKLGFNMIRKHIKIEPLLWYYYCDVYGVVVIQDMVNGGETYGNEVSILPFIGVNIDDTVYKNFHREDVYGRTLYEQELYDTVNCLYNCPSIAVWVPFNEGWGQFDSCKYYDVLKKIDSTRLVDTASGWHDRGKTDFKSEHIYFTPIRVNNICGNRPYLLSEFGGYSRKIKEHTFSDKMFGYKVFFTKKMLENAFSNLYENVIIPQVKRGGISGCVYTQLSDVEDELNGILTYDRKVLKIDKNLIKEINKKLIKELNDV